MPTLAKEPDLFPEHLFEQDDQPSEDECCWWVLYTRSRREKQLMRKLRGFQIPHYSPVVPVESRTPSGRKRTTYLPLFTNYVFLFGNQSQRYQAMTTNCVSRCLDVTDGDRLARELHQIHRLISTGLPISPEPILEAGQTARIVSGPLAGQQGVIIKRHARNRFLIAVDYLQQGASVLVDSIEVELITE